MEQVIQNMMRGLILHFLHQKSIEQAIEQGRKAGVPQELLETLPGMMFDITTAACMVKIGQMTLDNMADQITDKALSSDNVGDFCRDDAVKMIKMALEFIEVLLQNIGKDSPLPEMTEPWFHYKMEMPICH